MKTLGVIGGIAPESTIEYYRLLVAAHRERTGRYPSIVINSIDLDTMIGFIGRGELAQVTDYLAGELQRLVRAGAELALFASNTPHIVFDELRRRSPIPLVSIVESAAAAAKAMSLTRAGLFGTRFTMQGRFYPDVFAKQGIEIVIPDDDERTYIHDHYMNELVNGIFLPETRARLLEILDRLIDRSNIQALILGGTELPLILPDVTARVPFLDTTRIHVARAIDAMLDVP